MNAREQRLALAFLAVLVIGGGWLAFMKMARWKKDIESREHDVALRRIQAEELIKQKDFWNARSSWLAEKQPTWVSQRAADDEMNKLITESAKKEGVTVLASLQQEPVQESGLWASGITVEVKGPYDKTLQWLHRLQSPEGHETYDAYVSIKSLSLAPDVEDGTLIHLKDLHLQKWYRDASDAPPSSDKP
jgi:hypothetical protein